MCDYFESATISSKNDFYYFIFVMLTFGLFQFFFQFFVCENNAIEFNGKSAGVSISSLPSSNRVYNWMKNKDNSKEDNYILNLFVRECQVNSVRWCFVA